MSDNVCGIIYKSTNLINGKSYIGKTIQKFDIRKNTHIRDAKRFYHKGLCDNTNKNICYFHKAINKYGIENFKWEVIFECNDELVLNVMETMKIIVNHSHVSENGYNLTWGGEGLSGYKHTEETKQKIRKSNIESFNKEKKDLYRKMFSGNGNPMFGKSPSEETLLLLKKAHTGSNNGMYGKHHTKETRDKISQKSFKYSQSEIYECIEMHNNGITIKEISLQKNIPKSNIGRWCKETSVDEVLKYCK